MFDRGNWLAEQKWLSAARLFKSADCFSGKSGGEDAAETPQRRASGAFPMMAAPNAAASQAGGLVSTRGFVIDPTNKHHLKEVLHKQAQDTGVLSLRRRCEENETTAQQIPAVLLEGMCGGAVEWLRTHADPLNPPSLALSHTQTAACSINEITDA